VINPPLVIPTGGAAIRIPGKRVTFVVIGDQVSKVAHECAGGWDYGVNSLPAKPFRSRQHEVCCGSWLLTDFPGREVFTWPRSISERNEEASSWAATAIRQQPDHVAAYRVMTACHVTSGHIEEARQTSEIAMQLDPSQPIGGIKGLFWRTQDIEKLAHAWRIAGMPE
jgi:hypothetical protein